MLRLIPVLALLVLYGCSAAPAPDPAFPPVLNIENRGGPGFVVRINGTDVARAPCTGPGVYPLSPGEAGVPALPWAMSVTRQRDGKVILTADVSHLPMWLFQMGDEIGLNAVAEAGPPGPSCPPGE